jgi:hydroxyacylglutathione hydrolase
MELIQVRGNTWAARTKGLTIPFYRLNDRDVVMLDTGYAHPQREEFDEFLPKYGLRPAGVIVTHTHRDHSGNTEYFKKKYGSVTAAGEYEAKAGSDLNISRLPYYTLTPAEARMLADFLYTTDVVIGDGQKTLSFCGAEFGILRLPGHTPGQIGVVTPDNVAYLADALMGRVILDTAKLPTVDNHGDDIETKKSLLALHCDKYVLAHSDICDDITELVERNLGFLSEKEAAMLAALQNGMGYETWEEAFYIAAGMHTKNPLICGVYERNFRSFAGYLADIGRVRIDRVNGVNHYTKN